MSITVFVLIIGKILDGIIILGLLGIGIYTLLTGGNIVQALLFIIAAEVCAISMALGTLIRVLDKKP